MMIDWGFWLQVFHIRQLSLPDAFLPTFPQWWRTFIFMFWFSFSYGLMFSWMFLMFERKKEGLWWTLLLWGGWILIGMLSQHLPIMDDVFVTNRHMGGALIFQATVVLAGFVLLFILRYSWKTVLYLFMVGFLCHFMMESALWITGIRPGSLSIMLINSLVESNMGVPLLFILYDKVIRKKRGEL